MGSLGLRERDVIALGLSPNMTELMDLGLGQACVGQHLLRVARFLPSVCHAARHLHPGSEPKPLPWPLHPCWASLVGPEQVSPPWGLGQVPPASWALHSQCPALTMGKREFELDGSVGGSRLLGWWTTGRREPSHRAAALCGP